MACRSSSYRKRYNQIPYDIARCRWTDIVVIAPGQIDGTGDATGEVHHIVIGQCGNLLRGEHIVQTIEMWIAASTVVEITGHIREGGMVGYACCHTRVEACGDQREGTTLTATLYENILTIPFGQ